MLAEKMSRVPADSIAALRAGTVLPDVKLNALATFTRAMMASHGQPTPAEVEAFHAAGYTPRHAFGVILAIGVKTFSNYTNRLTGTPLDGVFAGYALAA
jgi:alkylhydroperoxidase family enzyme